ncbi:uncharacterized protein J7T54_003168 [Emericellopsis cladophorae]|uniref:Uncharacterized protein n=1 Tax=Emericellopsis cladophorae TaxID=2686198 RepID=A0A9Q0BDP1_9HYPO|nr:uncharacterized protein J7T54_003168 [Emericellopsis cladophorae]KAI6781026.1 hypothetical protein J7T54_003168 [Emericellopsis cladophorae]
MKVRWGQRRGPGKKRTPWSIPDGDPGVVDPWVDDHTSHPRLPAREASSKHRCTMAMAKASTGTNGCRAPASTTWISFVRPAPFKSSDAWFDWLMSISITILPQDASKSYFGGRHVRLDGHGQVWYDWARGRDNLARRLMMINWRHLHASVITNPRFVQAQMWTMATTWSHDLLFDAIYSNNTSNSNSAHSTLNTDGIDTIDSDDGAWRCTNITVEDFSVVTGDTKKPLTESYCANVHNSSGFECEPFPEGKVADELAGLV